MTIEVGSRLPDAKLMTMTAEGPSAIQAADFFAGKTVAFFALPGAYTPTCSARHLPGFVEKADALKAKGVDEIACLSVNDVFVMGAWGKDNGAEGKVTLLADGNAEFTTAVGLTMDGSGFGMGTRSQRYAMVVKDGVVEHLFIEEPGAFEVSSADHMLEQLG
ncbi:peroxiredoxin [Maricaulis sp. D1M11]|uniref:peroxiredoxin n=1 Tax=Maricaulis sp. D1M11 TaxID=3076117 RepID=UPI0039B3A377